MHNNDPSPVCLPQKVAWSTLPRPLFSDSEVGQMPNELVEMLGSMTEHMVRFKRVCEVRLPPHPMLLR